MIQQYTHAHPLALVSIAAPEDTVLLTQWETHLSPLQQAGFIFVWSEGHLAPGTDRVQELQHQVDRADLVVLLLSADFFTSPECLTMRDRALERAHEGTTRVIPLLLRPVAWQESPLGTLASWPPNGKPITLWSDQDEGWHTCVQELRRLLGRRVSEALRSERSVKQTDPDWDRMLRRLRRSYKELLDQSLHGIAWVELGLSTRPDLVSNVTNLLFRLPHRGERLLAPGTSIVNAYDEAEGELLILGAPGAGKSTHLLDLAQQLVSRALTDPSYPLPVILRLSSWAVVRPALTDWMIEQLSHTYDIPHSLSERWVKQGRVLPLLDGLDEMKEAARPACIATINDYHRTRLAPLVVCSRQREYEAAACKQRLALQGAVCIQFLSEIQIATILQEAGPSFEGLRAAWLQEPDLRKLATNPLMLSVQMLAYRDIPDSEIIRQGEEAERQVWTDYVRREVQEKGSEASYPLELVYAWLTFLARQMREHQQATFYAEYLALDWLSFDLQRTAIFLTAYLPAFLIGACAFLLVFALRGDFFSPMDFVDWGLIGGGIGIYVNWELMGKSRQHVPPRVRKRQVSQRSRLALMFGGFLAVSQALSFLFYSSYSFGDWVRDGSLFGLGGGLSLWLFQLMLSCPQGPPRYRKTKHAFWRKSRFQWFVSTVPASVWRAAAWIGGGIGLVSGLREGQAPTGFGLAEGLAEGSSKGLAVFVAAILTYAVLRDTTSILRFAERIHWTWHRVLQREHLQTSLAIAEMLFLFSVLSYGLFSVLSYVLFSGLNYGLDPGLYDALSTGLSTCLSYLIPMGLYQGVRQEHLGEQNRHLFNQGIRRSLCNGLLLALISASIITTLGMLNMGLRFGLHYGLNALQLGLNLVLSLGLSNIPTLFSTSLVLIWALSSGLTVLRHYMIRWLLARYHLFPWRAQEFLDDATTRILLQRMGGGYSFIHRRLQDYFADAVVPPSENLKSRREGKKR